ncbi:DUF2759 domain-containing protein [Bacillus sinesaloumensis]|uniref:DUF2759 domain-containing protein n=1 Tax=Litchfieldia sinesaloumensis TaxID=1926280 RepID=UPI000988305B|nr:DUF2759 domain-containing protein [Bacillus sinesaloumensis]
MGLMIIFSLVVILSAFGIIRSLREKNLLALFFSTGTFLVIGWFTIMTILKDGFPSAH